MIKRIVKTTLRPILTPFRPGNIAMFHLGRCGSTVVAELLKQHPRIYWGSELYSRILRQWEKQNNGKEVIEEMTENPIHYLQNDMQLALHRYYGFEVKPFHLRLIGYTTESYIQLLEEMHYTHYIILDRKNRMRKIVSSIIAHSNKNKYHIKNNANSSKTSIKIDVDNLCVDFDSKPLIEYLSDYDVQMNLLEEQLIGKNVLHLSYEEHIQDNPKEAYLKICEFLGIKPKKVDIRLSRTNPYPLKDIIENMDEVGDYLQGTPYEWMLEE